MTSHTSELQLSTKDTMELQTLGDVLEHEALTHYEDYLFRWDRQVDGTRWRAERTHGSLRVFSERKRLSTKHDSAYTPSRWIGLRRKRSNESTKSRFLITGTLLGTLDDAMYGSTFQDTTSLQTINAFTRGTDSAVVTTIESASHDDHYRFSGVTASTRDAWTLVKSGTANLSNGERVGFVLRRSIHPNDWISTQRSSYASAAASMLTVFRQMDERRIDVWRLSTERSTRKPRFHQRSANAPTYDLTSMCDAAFRRKLSWMLQQSRFLPLAHSDDSIEPMSSGCSDTCELCCRAPSTLFTRSNRTCRMCYKVMCTRCSVLLDMIDVDQSPTIEVVSMEFCGLCLHHTKSLPTQQLVHEELVSSMDRDMVSSNNRHDSRG